VPHYLAMFGRPFAKIWRLCAQNVWYHCQSFTLKYHNSLNWTLSGCSFVTKHYFRMSVAYES